MVVWLSWLVVALMLYIAQHVAILLMERRRQSHMTAWLFISYVCPYIGFIAYLMIGRAVTRRRHNEKENHERIRYATGLSSKVTGPKDCGNNQLMEQEKLYAMLVGLAPFPITSRNKALVLTNGVATFEAILEQLERAQHHIHLEFYTIRDDGIGKRFLEVLTKKARKGIEVRVLYDGIGSLQLSEDYIRKLHEAGARTSCFSPPRLAIYDRTINFRNHRKIVVVDGKVGFVGGLNIGDEYLGNDRKLGFWRDTHLQLEGDSVYFLQELFINDWKISAKEELEAPVYMQPHRCEYNERVLIVPGRPGNNDQKIMEVLFSAITAAKTRVYVTTPYFIPDPSIAVSLRTAARSGVDVRLIIPDVGDSKIILLATLSYVQDMLDAGVRIYRYQKGFIHAKVLLIDEMLASVGTANMDMRSLYSNYELNALLFEESSIRILLEDFMNDLQHSYELQSKTFAKRPWTQKTGEALMHMLSPLL